eukprot:CAMPEP_0117692176 /NCGR_PEP_ID=MMETSP0804-20121206/26171_1 /TAXON_ID=1074897 /ORGANISM="Tetraselmis astigmatica, Strain CCMP880" /LENGTH=367 /DNA_ID=CAMNT_0005505573 /DNA_START=579 /DNA_END=1683 /DNA_ORIENTATION=-
MWRACTCFGGEPRADGESPRQKAVDVETQDAGVQSEDLTEMPAAPAAAESRELVEVPALRLAPAVDDATKAELSHPAFTARLMTPEDDSDTCWLKKSVTVDTAADPTRGMDSTRVALRTMEGDSPALQACVHQMPEVNLEPLDNKKHREDSSKASRNHAMTDQRRNSDVPEQILQALTIAESPSTTQSKRTREIHYFPELSDSPRNVKVLGTHARQRSATLGLTASQSPSAGEHRTTSMCGSVAPETPQSQTSKPTSYALPSARSIYSMASARSHASSVYSVSLIPRKAAEFSEIPDTPRRLAAASLPQSPTRPVCLASQQLRAPPAPLSTWNPGYLPAHQQHGQPASLCALHFQRCPASLPPLGMA